MNERDSEFAAGVLAESGFKITDSPENADCVIFNSCSVRKHAEDRLFANIASLKKLKGENPGLLVGLMGCTAQAYKRDIFKRAPILDFICGPGNIHQLPSIIEEAARAPGRITATDMVSKKRPELFPRFRQKRSPAYVSISEGCDNFCSYCIVPYVRGRERSRRAEDIVREAEDLANRGFKEIMLLGQNVNSYGRNTKKGIRNTGFVKLLASLNAVKGIERIRFMTSHPKDASAGLFRAMAALDKVDKRLHLPLQSGSDRILKMMNRGYTAKRYLELARAYRKLVPSGEITTDVIVGFPSETKRDFNDTVRLMEKIRFNGAYIFKYSPRPPAASSKLADDVPAGEKQKRLEKILGLQRELARKRRSG